MFNQLGIQAWTNGDPDAAREHYETSLRMIEPFLGEANPNTMMVVHNLALTLRRPQDLPRAESLLRRNLELREQILGPGNPQVGQSWEALGVALALQGRTEEALAAYDSSLVIQREAVGDHAGPLSFLLTRIAAALAALGRTQEALDRLVEARAIDAARLDQGRSVDAWLGGYGLAQEALVRYELGDRPGALAALDEVTPALADTFPVGYAWIQAEVATVQTTLLLAEGRADQALPAARLALAKRLRGQADLTWIVGCQRALLAAALVATGEMDEARAMFAEVPAEAMECGYLKPLQRRLIEEAHGSVHR